jgi:hypothetical protein
MLRREPPANRVAVVEPHPIRLVVTDDLRRTRVTVFFRLLLVIPHLIWIALWTIAAAFAILFAWFAALFTKRVPAGLHDFLARYLRYTVHVYAYASLAADPFPPFGGREGTYPVDVTIAPPVEQSRLTVFFRIFLAIPALIIANVLNSLIEWVGILGWFVCMFTGKMPEGMRNLLVFAIRFHIQTQAYYSLLTERYPSFNIGLEQ